MLIFDNTLKQQLDLAFAHAVQCEQDCQTLAYGLYVHRPGALMNAPLHEAMLRHLPRTVLDAVVLDEPTLEDSTQ